MALTKIIGSGIGTVADNVVITSDDPTITMTDSSGTNDISTLQSTSGALIITVRDGTSDGEIIFKGDTGSAVTEHARIANTGLMTVISEGNAVQTSVQQGLLKAWGNLDGSGTVGNNDSFNMSTVTDRGTGLYTSNMTNNFSSGNAVMSGYSIMDGLVYGESGQVSNAGSFQFRVVVGHSNTVMDPDEMHTIHAGDLA